VTAAKQIEPNFIELLRASRVVRGNLRNSSRFAGASIKDAVVLARDNLVQWNEECAEATQ
jgi:hypothetical protein